MAARVRATWSIVGAAALLLAWLPVAEPARAASFAVTSAVDAVDANPGDGACETAPGNGVCTLRAAVMEANARPGPDAITLPAGVYTLTIPGNDDASARGDLDIVRSSAVTIAGAGAGVTVIDGNGGVTGDRVFDIAGCDGTASGQCTPPATVGMLTLSGVTVRNGRPTSSSLVPHHRHGAGIHNHGALTLTDSIVSANKTAASGDEDGGGGITNANVATLTNVVIADNEAATAGAGRLDGGGGFENRGTATLTNVTVRGNTAGFGGGIVNVGALTLLNSLVSGNRNAGAAASGAGIDNGRSTQKVGDLTVTSSTVSQNQGDGVRNDDATARVVNATLSGNAGRGIAHAGASAAAVTTVATTIVTANGAGNCAGAITSAGYNLDGAAGCPFARPGDRSNVDPRLGPLADNGGPTPTHALLAGSPAVDAVPGGLCPTTDQRGVARPQDGDGDGGGACDTGAYERSPGATTWYFAEGYTAPGFDAYLTIQNPTAQEAQLAITYYLTGAPPVVKSIRAPANGRSTVSVHDGREGVGRNQAVSAKVVSTNGVPVVVERPMYFRYGGLPGGVTDGHNVLGVQAPRARWLFAEGYTGAGFDEYLTILNPNPAPAPVTITYYLGGGQAPVVKTLTVPASARSTVTVHDSKEGVGRNQEVSARVETTLAGGIVVERPIYFRYALAGGGAAVDGGHNVMGAPEPRPVWYFADGNTTPGFDEYLTLMNPTATAAPVRLTYYVVGEGAPRIREIAVAANSRYTVAVHDAREGAGRGVLHGTKVESLDGVGLVAEKPMYFQFGGANGGSNVMGASGAAGRWLFAEGYTGTGFDEYLTVLNPGAVAAAVTITYYLASGAPVARTLAVAPGSRATAAVHDAGQVGRNQAVSVKVTSPVDVVAERAMYFRYTGSMGVADGGHTALGYVP